MDLEPVYSIILWAPPRRESEDEQVERVLQMVNILREYDPSIWPRYETAWSKRKAREYDFSEARTREIIRRERDEVFPDHGSRFGFFSNMDNDRSAGIRFNVGLYSDVGANSFVLSFPIEPALTNPISPFPPPVVEELFKRLVAIWEPYWGAVANSLNERRFSELVPKRVGAMLLPVTVSWMNYLGPHLVTAIGRRGFHHLKGVRVEPHGDGMLLVLLDEPFDDKNPDHLTKQQAVNRALGLPGAEVR